jgi:hypothetical protein
LDRPRLEKSPRFTGYSLPEGGELVKRKLSLIVLAVIFLINFPAKIRAQEPHSHQHDPSTEVGRVNFIVSCNPQARKQFNRAVAWLHSFEYEEAERAFNEIAAADSHCAMAYWGIAMSNYHPLWAPPSAAELQKGMNAIEKARGVGARTQRERDYISAIEFFYKDSDKLDHKARVAAYSEAMEQLHRRYPADREAGVFYALALIATGTTAIDKNYANEKKAAQILNAVLGRSPHHPGVAHYLIHGYDYPALAKLALPAARSYAKIAPASAHAQHMPSHIFTRLGFWQEAIRSNLAAKSSAKAYAARNKLTGVWDEQFHAMDYLAYAYLQGAQDKEAAGVVNELKGIQKSEPANFKVAYCFTAVPARYALERRQWNEASQLELPQGALGDFPWHQFPWALAHIHFARAVGAARTGNAAAARDEIEKLSAIKAKLDNAKGGYDWAKQVEIERLVASAWGAQAEGNRDEAIQLMRAAAELDDATEKHPVTPGSILPAREQLGELLMEMKQPDAALREFETSLITGPNRFNGLYGAARAAKLAGNHAKAKTYYAKLIELTRYTNSVRPEIEEAKAFLAGANLKDSASTR